MEESQTGAALKPRKRIVLSILVGGSVALTLVLVGSARSAPGARADHPLRGVAAIVEADIVSAKYAYDDVTGPRTVFVLGNIVVHAGSKNPPSAIPQFGGELPDGSHVGVTELPSLTPGSRYVFFLNSEPWFYTPIWTPYWFRVEQIGGRKVVIGPTGFPVKTVNGDGVMSVGRTQAVMLSGAVNPLSPLLRSGSVDSDPEIAEAMDVDSFVPAVVQILRDIGAPLGADVPSTPALLGNPDWRTSIGAPPKGATP